MCDLALCCSTVLSVTLNLLLVGHLCCEALFAPKDLVGNWDAVLLVNSCSF